MVVLKNDMGPTKKTKLFLRLKSENDVPNTKKNWWSPIFLFTNKKIVFKNGVPNKPFVLQFLFPFLF